MSGIEKGAIKPGDKVKIRWTMAPRPGSDDGEMISYKESPGWLVVRDDMGVLLAGDSGWYIERDNVTILDHQPAPRKVEVTLGEPLAELTSALYPGALPDATDLVVGSAYLNRIRFIVNDHGALLESDVARRVALDILATVGAEA